MEDFAHLVAELTEPSKKGDYAQVREVLRDAKRTHFLWQANATQQEAIDKYVLFVLIAVSCELDSRFASSDVPM